MKRAPWLHVVFALTSFLSVAAQTGPPFSLTISVEEDGLPVNRPVIVNTTLTNISNKVLTFEYTSPYCDNRFTVLDSSQHPVKDLFQCAGPGLTVLGRHFTAELKPGESSREPAEISIQKDLSNPGEYTVQAERDFPVVFGKGVVKSNVIRIHRIQYQPFMLIIDSYSEGKVPTTAAGLVAKAGAEIGINIEKRNLSKQDLDCSGGWSNITGLAENYQYNVRDASGNPVSVHQIDAPLPYNMGLDQQTCQPGMSGSSGNVMISRKYDLSRPGVYTIQISQPVPGDPENVVRSNVVTVTVTP